MKNSFIECRNIAWQLFSFRAQNTPFQVLLAFRVSLEKLA
jgi:hypothetical protein